MSTVEGLLPETLERAQELGFIGPGSIDPHIEHAVTFARVIEAVFGGAPPSVADLGSGGGLPALVMADRWPGARFALVESMARRARFLRAAVADFGWAGRVDVLEVRGEDAGHDPQLREAFDVVTARSFAAPAPTAEIGTGLLRIGGVLVVSEPPTSDGGRWPLDRLRDLGLGPAEVTSLGASAHFAVIPKVTAADENVPRRRALPFRRPRW